MRGKLKLAEKYAIQAMVADNKTVKEIQNMLSRPGSKMVAKYIEEELDKIHSTVAKVQMEQAQTEPFVSEELKERVVHQLTKTGLEYPTALNLVNKTIGTVEEKIENPDELYELCIQNRDTKQHMFVTKTQGGNEGVAIMTAPASQRSDDRKTKAKKKTNRAGIFHPKEGKMAT